jgi:sialic acid synthase SpsE
MDLIAEIGWNHMGDFSLIKKMVSAAAEAGASYAKFQTWSEKNLRPGPWDDDGRRDIYRKAQLTAVDFLRVKAICEEHNIKFLTSLFNAADLEDMASVSDEAVKIPSPEIANVPLLKGAGKRFKKVYLSTGASTEEELDKAIDILCSSGCEFTVLHCVSLYPCPDDKVNLQRIEALKKKHDRIGFSDHTTDSLSALFAIAMGVTCIEKHFTIDNDLPGRDNRFALLPGAFKKIVEAARRYEDMSRYLGLEFQPEEKDQREIYRGRWRGND